MSNGKGRDVARQATNVAGAIFQALGGVFFVANLSAEPVADRQGSTLVDPAGYAFFVWAPILLLSLAYAAYQALPSKREDELLRRVGWPLAGAFFANGLWEFASPLGRLGLAQVLIAGILAFLAAAYLRLARSERATLGRAGHWLIGPTVGIYFGWITAANAVSLTSLAARSDLVDGKGLGGAVLGISLLVLGVVLASAAVLAARNGPSTVRLAYAGTVLWALVSIIVEQYDASAFAAAAASLCAVLVVASSIGAARASRASSRDVGVENPKVS